MKLHKKLSKKKLFFNNEALEFSDEGSVLAVILKHNKTLSHSCDGNGSCGTCRVIVEDWKKLPPRNEIEKSMAEDRGFESFERLACQTEPKENLCVFTPKKGQNKKG